MHGRIAMRPLNSPICVIETADKSAISLFTGLNKLKITGNLIANVTSNNTTKTLALEYKNQGFNNIPILENKREVKIAING